MTTGQKEKAIALVSIDVGTQVIGWASWAVSLRTMKLLGSGQELADGSSVAMRNFVLAEKIEARVRQAGAKIVAIEGGFVQFKHRDRKTGKVWSNPVSNLTLAKGRGAAEVAAIRGGAERVVEISPSTAKKAATGNGNADKWTVREYVRAQLKMERLPGEDEADAIAVGLAAINQLQDPTNPSIYFDP